MRTHLLEKNHSTHLNNEAQPLFLMVLLHTAVSTVNSAGCMLFIYSLQMPFSSHWCIKSKGIPFLKCLRSTFVLQLSWIRGWLSLSVLLSVNLCGVCFLLDHAAEIFVVTSCGRKKVDILFVFLAIHVFKDLQLIMLLLKFLWLLLWVSPLSWGLRARLIYLITSTPPLSWIRSSCFLWRLHFSTIFVKMLKAYLPEDEFIFSNDLAKIQSNAGCKYLIRLVGCLFLNACNSA